MGVAVTLSDGYTTWFDGVSNQTVFNLNDGANWQIEAGGWRPKVAPLRDVRLGGQWHYTDVVEEISFASITPQHMTELNQLCNRARRFSKGDSVAPVVLSYQVDALTKFSAALLSAELVYPQDWIDTRHSQSVIEKVLLRGVRRGPWSVVDPATSSFVAAGTLTSGVVLADRSNGFYSDMGTPLSLRLGPYTSSSSQIKPGSIAITRKCDDITKRGIVVVNSESAVSTTGTPVAGTGALGGNVTRCAIAQLVLLPAVPASFPLPKETKRVGIFVSCKNGTTPSATTPAFYVQTVSSANNFVYESRYITPVAENVNTVMFAGFFDYSEYIDRIALVADGGTVDFDYIAIVRADDYGTFMLDFETNTPNVRNYSLSTGKILINNNPLTTLSPRASFLTAGGLEKTLAPSGDYGLAIHDKFDILYMAHGQGNTWSPATVALELQYAVTMGALGYQ